MSHIAFDLQWQEAMTELMEQVHLEQTPAEKGENGVAEFDNWEPPRFFAHFSYLYIRYIEIFRKLEECYDQIVHPQKRIAIKQILDSTIVRILEIKESMIFFNPRKKCIYVNIDDLLSDLKVDPSRIEMPIPYYFLEEDKNFEQRRQLIDKLLIMFFGSDEPEEDEIEDVNFLEFAVEGQFDQERAMDIAIRLIQKNERGRQGIERTMQAKQIDKERRMKQDRKKRAAKGEELPEEDEDEVTAQMIQKVFRSFCMQVFVNEIRQNELEFLGMAPQTNKVNNPIKNKQEIVKERRLRRVEYENEYTNALVDLKEFVHKNEGPEIHDKLLDARQDWVIKYREQNAGAIPTDIKQFYEQEKLDALLMDEEAAAKYVEEQERLKQEKEDKKKKKKKDKEKGGKKKGKKKKKGGKKKKKTDEDEKGTKWIEVSKQVFKFQEGVTDYQESWENRDESHNQAQRYDTEKAKEEVRPEIMEIVTAAVDEYLKADLENLKNSLSGKGKKGKRKGKGKKKKKGKNKKKKGGKKKGKKEPGSNFYKNPNPEALMYELVEQQVVRKLVPSQLSDFRGTFDYLGTLMQHKLETKDPEPNPSYAQIRQLITEYCILPMGLNSEIRESIKDLHTPSVLLYGPPGSGKTQLVRAIATHLNAIIIDLSPFTVKNLYVGETRGHQKLLFQAFKVAREYAPAIIYIDECEKVFAGAKKGKRKKGSKKGKGDRNISTMMKKDLITYKKILKPKDRVLIIGCTSNPWDAGQADLKSFFKKKIYIPHPNYATRKELWEHYIAQAGVEVNPNKFHFSVLAQISEGYTAGSIVNSINKVLTDRRKANLKRRPLAINEFIGPLSRQYCACTQEYDTYQAITYDMIGMKKIAADEKKKAEEAEGGPAKKGGKGKGKGGKKKKKGGKKKKR